MSPARDELFQYVESMKQLTFREHHHLNVLLDQVEDDHAHCEAVRLRHRAQAMRLDLLDPFSPYRHQLVRDLADAIDPYEERDGRLFRKSDGTPVTL